MSANVIELNPDDLRERPKAVLQQAIDNGVSPVVILGYDVNGNEYFAASTSDAHEVNWLLDRLKAKLLT